MKDWYKKVSILWTIISTLFLALVSMIAINLSYQPEISRLRTENEEQEKEIIRLRTYKNLHEDEFKNIYNIFFDYNLRIKTLEGD